MSSSSCARPLDFRQLELRKPTGETVLLQSLWQDRKVVLIFLRQLACRYCRQQVMELQGSGLVERLNAHGVACICVSMGSPAQATEWLEVTKFSGELYVDETSQRDMDLAPLSPMSKPYEVFQLKRGRSLLRIDDPTYTSYSESVAKKYPDMMSLAEMNENGTVKLWPGDVFQTGGVFVLGAGNVCDYAFRSEYAGHHPDLSEVFEHATGLEKNGGGELVFPSTKKWFNGLKVGKRVQFSIFSDDAHADFSTNPAIGFLCGWSRAVVQSVRKTYKQSCATFLLGAGASFLLLCLKRRSLPASPTPAFRPPSFSELRSHLLHGAAFSSLYLSGMQAVRSLNLFALFTPPLRGIDLSEVKLLTPIDIDDKVLASGMPECDCGAEVAMLPFFGIREQERDDGKATSRRRTQTWTGENGTNEFQNILCYVREFLGKPHPAVGRGGPVCPFVPTSLKKNCIYFSVIRTSSLVKSEITQDKTRVVKEVLTKLLKDFIPVFEKLEPSEGKMRQFKAVVLIFPDIRASDAHAIIDAVQVLVKSFFVEKGLMVGEFHIGNNASGLRNKDFFPLRTPYPCLAIRHMVIGDFVFMNLEDYAVELRAKFLRSFLGVFGEETDKPQVEMAKKELARVEAILKEGLLAGN